MKKWKLVMGSFYQSVTVIPAGGRRTASGEVSLFAEPKSWGVTPSMIKSSEKAGFAKRLAHAAAQNPYVPEINRGRLTWIRAQLEKRYGENVSLETVRKWFAGESRPRHEKMKLLAELLQVDLTWLSLGAEGGGDVRERRARNASVDGAVNLVAGLIQMGGGAPAFPEEDDAEAHEVEIDLHAIIKGAHYDLHVCLAKSVTDTEVSFAPTSHFAKVFTLAVIPLGAFCFDILELPVEVIEQHGRRLGGVVELVVSRKGDGYTVGETPLPKIESFNRRI